MINKARINTYRKHAPITGVLYLIGTVAGVISVILTNPLLAEPDLLASVFADSNRLISGTLFVLIMALALVLVAVIMYPVLRWYNEVLALGYVVFRGRWKPSSIAPL